jgi:hypothetical protein
MKSQSPSSPYRRFLSRVCPSHAEWRQTINHNILGASTSAHILLTPHNIVDSRGHCDYSAMPRPVL